MNDEGKDVQRFSSKKGNQLSELGTDIDWCYNYHKKIEIIKENHIEFLNFIEKLKQN